MVHPNQVGHESYTMESVQYPGELKIRKTCGNWDTTQIQATQGVD